jgi:hypothetical protein
MVNSFDNPELDLPSNENPVDADKNLGDRPLHLAPGSRAPDAVDRRNWPSKPIQVNMRLFSGHRMQFRERPDRRVLYQAEDFMSAILDPVPSFSHRSAPFAHRAALFEWLDRARR